MSFLEGFPRRGTWRTYIGCAVLSLVTGVYAPAQSPNLTPSNPSDVPSTYPIQDLTENAHNSCSFLEIIGKSMFGKQPSLERQWTPLRFSDIAEGWNEPWMAPPDGSGGALRQGWVNTSDAFFNRNFVGNYSFARGISMQPDEHVGTAVFETPLSRRYMFGIVAPFVDSVQNGTAPDRTAFGDLTIENRFLLEETRDFTLSFNVNGRIPTGDPGLGAHRTSLNPYLSFFKDTGRGFSVRGAAGIDVPVDNKPDGISSTLIGQLAIGQTITPHDVPLLGDFTYYVSVNFREALGTDSTFVSLTPGFRTFLGHNFWLVAGVEVPVADPRPFAERYVFTLVKGF